MRKKAHFGYDLPDSFIEEIGKLIDSGKINTDEYLVFELKINEEIYKIDIGMSLQEKEKLCNKCGQIKPIDEFYKGITRRSGSGKESTCKECKIEGCSNYHKKQAMMYRYKNKIKIPRKVYTIEEGKGKNNEVN